MLLGGVVINGSFGLEMSSGQQYTDSMITAVMTHMIVSPANLLSLVVIVEPPLYCVIAVLSIAHFYRESERIFFTESVDGWQFCGIKKRITPQKAEPQGFSVE